MLILSALLFAGCEKMAVDDISDSPDSDKPTVVLRFAPYDIGSFPSTRAVSALSDCATRLSVAVFDSDGNKLKTISQRDGDTGFGTVGLSLPAGDYCLVAIAHNGSGTATISSADKVTFTSNKVTDTFYYYGSLTVADTDAEPLPRDLHLQRCVAMVRFVFTDATLPTALSRMKIYYTGGSSTFSPSTGFGCVNSRQTEYRTLEGSQRTMDIFTMPHEQSDQLKIVVSALDDDDQVLMERTFETVPVVMNQITTYTGQFFGDGGTAGSTQFTISVDSQWDAVTDHTF